MSSLFPIRSTVEARGDGEPRFVRVDSDDAGPVMDALSSETARRVLAAVHEEPGTKSDLAERIDTSLQNVSYHLENLAAADLVVVVDTWYSSRGREMPVYGAAGGPVVVFAGPDEPSPDLRRALASAVGALGVLGLLSLAVQWLFGQRTGAELATTAGGDGGDAAFSAAETTVEAAGDAGGGAATTAAESAGNASLDAAREATTTVATGGDSVGFIASTADWLAGLPPGALFFAGGALVVALGLAWWALRQR